LSIHLYIASVGFIKCDIIFCLAITTPCKTTLLTLFQIVFHFLVVLFLWAENICK